MPPTPELRLGSKQQEAAVNLCWEPSARHRTPAGGFCMLPSCRGQAWGFGTEN